jgi:hypothetical protein
MEGEGANSAQTPLHGGLYRKAKQKLQNILQKLGYGIFFFSMLCYAMLCYAMLYYAILLCSALLYSTLLYSSDVEDQT